MKKINLSLFLILIAGLSTTFAQKIAESKKDDFTNAVIKRTSWESLTPALSSSFTAYFRISQVNDHETFDLKLMLNKIFSISEGNQIMFKLENGDVVKLGNDKYAITCTGCGATGLKGSEAQGIEASYTISKEIAEKLKTNKIVKIRIETTETYVENDLKAKFAESIQKALSLI